MRRASTLVSTFPKRANCSSPSILRQPIITPQPTDFFRRISPGIARWRTVIAAIRRTVGLLRLPHRAMAIRMLPEIQPVLRLGKTIANLHIVDLVVPVWLRIGVDTIIGHVFSSVPFKKDRLFTGVPTGSRSNGHAHRRAYWRDTRMDDVVQRLPIGHILAMQGLRRRAGAMTISCLGIAIAQREG